jgi:hypothetical protein
MQPQSQKRPNAIAHALAAVYADHAPRAVYLTVDQLAERNPAFTIPALRNLIFKAETRQSSRGPIAGNGLLEAGAILRLGRRVLIDEAKFLTWVARCGGAK